MSRPALPRVSFKAVLLGDSGVGKTSLVTRWTTGAYAQVANPTIGANHQRRLLTVDAQEVDLLLWDTAGQEQFQALTPLYAHSASCALIVVAINDRDSFSGIPTWTGLLAASCARVPPTVLLVNKMDCASRASYSTEEIKDRHGPAFQAVFFVSAVTGEGVDAAFLHAGELAYGFSDRAGEPGIAPVGRPPSPAPKVCCA
jgi:small GTP-binding protein